MIARAPGKLVLSGAYAVLSGAPALVAAVDRYATADASRSAAFVTEEVSAAIRGGALTAAPWFDAAPLRAPLADGSSRKLGLGSSAAILVASLAAARARTGVAEGELAEEVFPLALECHRAAQGGGSGIDVAASTFGGVLAVRRTPAGLFHEAHALPAGTVVTVFASRTAASTPALLAGVRAFAASNPIEHGRWIAELSDAALEAWSAASITALVASLQAQRALLRRMGELARLPIVPDELEALARRATTEGAAFGPSGAGGGDVSLHVAARQPSADLVARAAEIGLDRLEIALGARGVHLVPRS